MTPQQKYTKLCQTLPGHLQQLLPQYVPPTGKTQGFSLHFDTPFAGWHAAACGVMVSQSYRQDDLRTLEAYARMRDSEYVIKNILMTGTTEEIIGYLQRPGLGDELEKLFVGFNEKLRDKGYPLG